MGRCQERVLDQKEKKIKKRSYSAKNKTEKNETCNINEVESKKKRENDVKKEAERCKEDK